MLSPHPLKWRAALLSLLAVLILMPTNGLAKAPVPESAELQVEQAETVEPAGESLDNEELERLQAMDEEPEPEVVGGALSNENLTYVVIALAAAVLVLVLQ